MARTIECTLAEWSAFSEASEINAWDSRFVGRTFRLTCGLSQQPVERSTAAARYHGKAIKFNAGVPDGAGGILYGTFDILTYEFDAPYTRASDVRLTPGGNTELADRMRAGDSSAREELERRAAGQFNDGQLRHM